MGWMEETMASPRTVTPESEDNEEHVSGSLIPTDNPTSYRGGQPWNPYLHLEDPAHPGSPLITQAGFIRRKSGMTKQKVDAAILQASARSEAEGADTASGAERPSGRSSVLPRALSEEESDEIRNSGRVVDVSGRFWGRSLRGLALLRNRPDNAPTEAEVDELQELGQAAAEERGRPYMPPWVAYGLQGLYLSVRASFGPQAEQETRKGVELGRQMAQEMDE